MWFRLPEGCSGISVERQEFNIEYSDEKGVNYFRAPDHFAPKILAIKGFAMVDAPVGAPDDLPKADPLRDGAIAELTATAEAQKTQLQNMRSDLEASTSRIVALSNENSDLRKLTTQQAAQIEAMKELLQDADISLPAGMNK